MFACGNKSAEESYPLIFGTVEVRMCDMPPDLPSVLALAALIQCLVTEAAAGGAAPIRDEVDMAIVRQNRWRAARYGLDAELVAPRTAGQVFVPPGVGLAPSSS